MRYQLATLRSDVATLKMKQSNMDLAQKDYARVAQLVRSGAGSPPGGTAAPKRQTSAGELA